jgi:hypothetical protein
MHPLGYLRSNNDSFGSTSESAKEDGNENKLIPPAPGVPKMLGEALYELFHETKKDLPKKFCEIHGSCKEIMLPSHNIKISFGIVTEKDLTPKPESKAKHIIIEPRGISKMYDCSVHDLSVTPR